MISKTKSEMLQITVSALLQRHTFRSDLRVLLTRVLHREVSVRLVDWILPDTRSLITSYVEYGYYQVSALRINTWGVDDFGGLVGLRITVAEDPLNEGPDIIVKIRGTWSLCHEPTKSKVKWYDVGFKGSTTYRRV